MHDHHHPSHGHHQGKGWQPHKDWRLWVGVVLMLAAMFVYLMSQDESRIPGPKPPPANPPANAPQ